ncbi:hypothetical protein N0V88_004679 [Collariella sp. IMI 366227]|nr:hypothetical protein N0V88_004679 [Collariella sp. IMI 366227]
MVDRPVSWLPSSKSSPNIRSTQEHRPKRLVKHNVASVSEVTAGGNPLETARPVESFADFAKRSWISKSRSPSPPSKPEKTRGAGRDSSAETPATTKPKTTPGNKIGSEGAAVAERSSSRTRAFSRASIYFTKIKQKPQSVFSRSTPSLALKTSVAKSVSSSDSDSGTPTAATPTSTPGSPAITKNASYHSISTATSQTSSQRTPSVDTELDTDTTTASSASENTNTSRSTTETSVTMPHPTSRDPLWATFKTLDLEFSKFATKGSTHGRMSSVKAILVPFLRSTAYHPSNSNRSTLTAEDFDRRATILNKWWNGLLAMLAGASSRLPPGLNQGLASLGVQFPPLTPLPGVDRPVLLEAATLIMMRPEWRVCTSHFQPLADRSPAERVRPRSGTHSTVASDPDSLLAESAEHNIRTMFVTNLTTQMALAVEKLSIRHAPTSLGLSADLMRRIAEELGLPRRSKGESDDIVSLFPPHLHKLGWSSAKLLSDKLRVAAKLPLMLAKIHWHGPWVSRWRGGDTDLVFVFCKYFYMLAQEFMPDGLPVVEKARAPAFVLVHAQLLSILDSTIHRQASLDALLGPPLSDALHGADAALTAPQLPSNIMKGMNENRLVVLLKDMLSEHSFGSLARAGLLKRTPRTPRFEHASCFMLCDFLEEALVALDTFQTTVNTTVATSPAEGNAPSHYFDTPSPSRIANYIDWPFWFDVGKMIMNSNNTMSEIRILSFIFSVWDAITADPARKEAVCLEWLLSEEVFAKFFNHWCPMVRAYYMRLLCWRVCRDSGSANEVDTALPTSESTFDYLLPAIQGDDGTSGAEKTDNLSFKKRWSLLGKVLPFGASQDNAGPDNRRTWEEALEQARRDTAASRVTTRVGRHEHVTSLANTFVFRFTLTWQTGPNGIAMPCGPTRDRIITRPRLPAPAQSRVSIRSSGLSNDDANGISVFRSDSPPPIRPGLPPETRRVSGLLQTGLVSEARNAKPLVADDGDEPRKLEAPKPMDKRLSLSINITPISLLDDDDGKDEDRLDFQSPLRVAGFTGYDTNRTQSLDASSGPVPQPPAPTVRAEKPAGVYAPGAVYAGRALAEWCMVVGECNSFVDRRRDEGVLGLNDVETYFLSWIPTDDCGSGREKLKAF